MRRVPGIGIRTVPGIQPFGFGMNQQTLATRVLTAEVNGTQRAPRRRKSSGKKKSVARARPAKRRARGGGKFVKGSAAAKRHMAKLRRMRRK